MTGAPTFDLLPLRFHFKSSETLQSPEAIANRVRGSLGKNLKRMSCDPACIDARTCSQRDTCDYGRWFEPASLEGPSGLHDRPRPFVLRVAHLDARQPFCVGLNLFEMKALDVFTRAMAQFAELESVEGTVPLQLPLAPVGQVTRVRVRFMTPTELKGCDQPEFGVLFARIRDRVSTLRSLYGAGPINLDFKAMGERAGRIQMTRCEIRHVEAERFSRRSGQRHSLGGFTGIAEYEGDLGEFVPFLEIAHWTGVGRQTVWGKGEIGCEIF